MLNLITNSVDLSGGITGTDNKVVSKAAHILSIQQDNINRLLIAGRLYQTAGYIQCFQKLILPLYQPTGTIIPQPRLPVCGII